MDYHKITLIFLVVMMHLLSGLFGTFAMVTTDKRKYRLESTMDFIGASLLGFITLLIAIPAIARLCRK